MMRTAYWLLGSMLTVVGVFGVGSAQTLTWLGTLGGGSSSAYSVSDDGSVVVGTSDTSGNGVRAFRWTQSTGMVSLGTLGGLESFGRAVSGDGSVIVGAADSNSRREAFRWTQSTGMQPIEPRGLSSAAAGVSANGLVVAGVWRFSISPLVDYGFVRTLVQTFDLEAFSGSRVFVNAISRNGGVVVGCATIYPTPNVTVRAFRWTASGGMQNLGQLGTGVFNNSEAFCLSEDGAIVYGLSEQGTGGGMVMFRWTAQTGMQSTGAAMNPLATTADGAVVVGHVNFVNAVRWTQANGIENLNTTYASLLSDGSRLAVATAVSPDGRFIVGQGYNAATDRNEAFLLDTQSSCAAHNGDVDASGCVDDADLLAVLFAFGQTGQNLGRVDINCDGAVDDADLLIVLFNFGVGC